MQRPQKEKQKNQPTVDCLESFNLPVITNLANLPKSYLEFVDDVVSSTDQHDLKRNLFNQVLHSVITDDMLTPAGQEAALWSFQNSCEMVDFVFAIFRKEEKILYDFSKFK